MFIWVRSGRRRIAFIIVCTAATLYKAGISVDSAQQAAMALEPLAGRYAFILFGAGLFGASVLAASVIPLSTSYMLYARHSAGRAVLTVQWEAPIFFGIYTFYGSFCKRSDSYSRNISYEADSDNTKACGSFVTCYSDIYDYSCKSWDIMGKACK